MLAITASYVLMYHIHSGLDGTSSLERTSANKSVASAWKLVVSEAVHVTYIYSSVCSLDHWMSSESKSSSLACDLKMNPVFYVW